MINFFEHKHKWKGKWFNRYGLSTGEACKCGISRQVIAKPDSKNIGSNFWWEYSDGTLKPDERCFKHT